MGFSSKIFSLLIDIVEVFSKKEINIHFKNADEVKVNIIYINQEVRIL